MKIINPNEYPILAHMISRKTYIENFTESDFNKFDIFKTKAKQLYKSLNGLSTPITSHIKTPDGPRDFKSNDPIEKDLIHLAVRCRPFILKGEPTNYNNIINILKKKTKETDAHGWLLILHSHFKELTNNTEQTKIFGSNVTNKILADWWLNADIFHTDIDKLNKLTEINSAIGESVSKNCFYIYLRYYTNSVLDLYTVLHKTTSHTPYIYTPNCPPSMGLRDK